MRKLRISEMALTLSPAPSATLFAHLLQPAQWQRAPVHYKPDGPQHRLRLAFSSTASFCQTAQPLNTLLSLYLGVLGVLAVHPQYPPTGSLKKNSNLPGSPQPAEEYKG
ncbi:MAG: hypothetical protein KME26_21720 [Oscillatoria princeps RMCB-10]|nr:hypothetical protein [Oscillatoria princeps RMCB-10]